MLEDALEFPQLAEFMRLDEVAVFLVLVEGALAAGDAVLNICSIEHTGVDRGICGAG